MVGGQRGVVALVGKIMTGEEGEVGVANGLEEDMREVSECFFWEGVKSCRLNVGRDVRNL